MTFKVVVPHLGSFYLKGRLPKVVCPKVVVPHLGAFYL